MAEYFVSLGTLPSLAALAVFSGLSVNLVLQCGLCLKEAALDKTGKKKIFAESGMIFITVIVLWLFFSLLRRFLPLGFFEYTMLFPLSCLTFFSLDYLFSRYILRKNPDEKKRVYREAVLTSAALFITLNVAGRIVEAAVTALGFVLGVAVVFLIVGEVRRRSSMEAVPAFLKGGPLALITMGLLSLVFSLAAVMFFRFLEG